MQIEPVPAWYFILVCTGISLMCAWFSCKVMNKMEKQCAEEIRQLAQDVWDCVDEEEQDTKDKLEKVLSRITYLEKHLNMRLEKPPKAP